MKNHLKEIRKSKKLTLRDLSEKTGISRSQLSYFERGEKDITTEKLCQIAIALEVGIENIIVLEDIISKMTN